MGVGTSGGVTATAQQKHRQENRFKANMQASRWKLFCEDDAEINTSSQADKQAHEIGLHVVK